MHAAACSAAWNARAAPGSQRDPKDALPAIDRARGLDDLTDRPAQLGRDRRLDRVAPGHRGCDERGARAVELAVEVHAALHRLGVRLHRKL
ncbi:MAG: hypothetical protein ACKOTD_13760, partial [Phycisphaerales bacterium]